MTTTTHPSRRPSVSIYDYPEELNPFKDDEDDGHNADIRVSAYKTQEPIQLNRHNIVINNYSQSHINGDKEPKHKFWTFGRSRKKRSNSFSIKSTWNGIFGKKKNTDPERKQPTITTVSSTYNKTIDSHNINNNNNADIMSGLISNDQREFDEALMGTLTRRRKNTWDCSSSRYNSSLTVNGEPGRLYDGCPQDTTTSIMVDLTPKPPVRRFGQVTAKPTDQIPPLNYKDQKNMTDDKDTLTPIPPKRGELRSSYRNNTLISRNENHAESATSTTISDENDNMPEDYIFKRCNYDNLVRKSNLSINSCVSMTSVYQSGRKKRRAPQPPERKPLIDSLQPPKENTANDADKEIIESAITKVAKSINTEITRKNTELNNNQIGAIDDKTSSSNYCSRLIQLNGKLSLSKDNVNNMEHENVHSMAIDDCHVGLSDNRDSKKSQEETNTNSNNNNNNNNSKHDEDNDDKKITVKVHDEITVQVIPVEQIELKKAEETNREIVKDVEIIDDDEEIILRKKIPSIHSSNDSFSVKEEIEKIERQIKLLEAKGASSNNIHKINNNNNYNIETKQRNITRTYSLTDDYEDVLEGNRSAHLQRGHFTRRSLQEHRRNFFKELTRHETDNNIAEKCIKIEIKELPREQKVIKIVRLNDDSTTDDGAEAITGNAIKATNTKISTINRSEYDNDSGNRQRQSIDQQEPVKVIERHISEPIKQKAEFNADLDFINPIPKPRRYTAHQSNQNNNNNDIITNDSNNYTNFSNYNHNDLKLSKEYSNSDEKKSSEKDEETSSL